MDDKLHSESLILLWLILIRLAGSDPCLSAEDNVGWSIHKQLQGQIKIIFLIMNRLTDGIIHLSVEQNWNFKNTIACFYDIPHSNYVIVICIARLFYGGVCFAGRFILRCCSLQLSGRPTASNKHHFSLYVKTFFFLSVFLFFLINPPGHSEPLCFSLPVMFICSSTSLWFYGLCFSIWSAYAWLGLHF